MSDDVRTPYDGKSYYCDSCGVGYDEYLACEEVDCKLEADIIAKKRKLAHEKNKEQYTSKIKPFEVYKIEANLPKGVELRAFEVYAQVMLVNTEGEKFAARIQVGVGKVEKENE